MYRRKWNNREKLNFVSKTQSNDYASVQTLTLTVDFFLPLPYSRLLYGSSATTPANVNIWLTGDEKIGNDSKPRRGYTVQYPTIWELS